jgi:hypothetical protein
MKTHACLSASFIAAALAVATPARAEHTARVHVDASSAVVLERVDHGHVAPACRAPCDATLDADGRYRVAGDGIRPSAPFKLDARGGAGVVVSPRTRSSSSFVTGILLTSIATAFLAGGVGSSVGAFLLSKSNVVAGAFVLFGVALPCFAASLATGIPGTVMLVSNVHSEVTQRADVGQARPRAPSFTSVSILSGSF